MKEMTLQLFEYLLAAKNSRVPINQSLDDDQQHWFLDELIQLDSVRIIEENADVSYIEVSCPSYEKPEESLLLSEVFRMLGSNHSEMDSGQLEAILLKECALLKAKLNKPDHELIDLNEWQKLLLNVSAAQLPVFMITKKMTCCNLVINDIVSEYQDWLQASKTQNQPLVEGLYAHLKEVHSSVSKTKKLALGVGILRLQSTPAVFQPILTMEVDVEMDPSRKVCRISIKDKSLKIEEELLEHALFHDPEGANYLKAEINRRLILPFDNDAVGDALQKIVTMIHPQGQYITSSRDMEQSKDHLPTIFHRSTLFTKEIEVDRSTSELKETIKYLENNGKASDVIRSIVDSAHRPDSASAAEWMSQIQTVYPLSSDGAEKMVMNALATNDGVVVNETCSDSKINAIANLITHFTSLGKRTLIVGQDGGELLKIQTRLPHYLKGMQRYLTLEPEGGASSIGELKSAFANHRSVFSGEMHQLIDEIARVDEKIVHLQTQIVRYRELSSNKVLWKGRHYHPYELSQFLAKLGEPGHVIPDPIPMEANLKASRLELQKMWDSRRSFTPENLDLLNYDFIHVNDVLKDEEYRKLLMAEKRYLALVDGLEGSDVLFDATSDPGFIHYLHDKLPRLIQEISDVVDDYEYGILMDAITSLGRYHQLARLLDQFSDQIDRLENFIGTEAELKQFIAEMNQTFYVTSDAPEFDLSRKVFVIEFYMKKKLLMSQALQKANAIWLFNEESRMLSPDFKGISATNLLTLDALHRGALLYLTKTDFEVGWSYVSEHLTHKYQSVLQRPDLHPICLAWYEALQDQNFEAFKTTLQEMKDLTVTRANFTDFAELSALVSESLPSFVPTLLSEERADEDMPDYHAAFDYAQLSTFFGRLHEHRISDLENHLLMLRGQKQELIDELTEKRCWVSAGVLEKAGKGLAEPTLVHLPICFMPVADQPWETSSKRSKLDINPDSFDVAIFADASKQSVFSLARLMFADKAILFGRASDAVTDYVTLDDVRAQKMSDRYGPVLHRFGGQYLMNSLFDLIGNATAWNARIELPNRLNKEWMDQLGRLDAVGFKKYDNAVEEEIFEALLKKGYDIRSKIKVGEALLDLVVVGKTNKVAINIVGDVPMDREEILAQMEQEMQLRELGLNIYNLSATEFYLNSRQVLQEVNDYLDRLNI